MKKALQKFIVTYFSFLFVFMLGKPLFISVYHSLFQSISIGDVFSVIWHGLPIDFAVAAYCTVIPAILIIAMLCTRNKVTAIIEHAYYIVISIVIALVYIADLVLYDYWGFRLDSTPLFYIFTSPVAAAASATWLQATLGAIALAVLSGIIYFLFRLSAMRIAVVPAAGRRKAADIAVVLVLTALLFIPIRGGFTVSTMNPSRAYFSTDKMMNHAAMNPLFSFLYSVTHQTDFKEQYRFMDAEKADRIFNGLVATESVPDTTLLNTSRPDIWLIIAESFSSHLLPVQGGEAVAVRLDSIARDGLLFDRFYASSFRTDRALPAILSAFPGQPNSSVMKFVNKAEKLPSIAATLNGAGYDSRYYYGGDINFTNMQAYLISGGFGHIVCDKDFSVSQKTGKWGAHDSYVFDKVVEEMKADTTDGPRFRVIQTLSSHEPFDVPFTSSFADERANAFAYVDDCIGRFVDSLRTTSRWDRTLVVVVPDHYGAYPDNISDEQQRHRIPLVMTGGALKRRGRVDAVGSQTDIAAILLSALGLDHSDFIYSKDILNPDVPHYAVYTSPSSLGFVTAADTVDFNLESNRPVIMKGADAQGALDKAKAFVQKLYDNISEL